MTNFYNNITVIPDLFNSHEMHSLNAADNGEWKLNALSTENETEGSVFWNKNLRDIPIIKNIFKNKIENILKTSISINDLYANGQSHGQCGDWHTDSPVDNDLTLIYFPLEWLPLYGGHLLIEDENRIISILPELNKGVLFPSSRLHVGLEPTSFCKRQRESIACKFRVIDV